MVQRWLGVAVIVLLMLGSTPISAQSAPIINSFTANKTDSETYVLNWNVANAQRVILNPGNIDVTDRNSYTINLKSDTIYNLVAYSAGQKTTSRLILKTNNRLPKTHGLWIGPWFIPKS